MTPFFVASLLELFQVKTANEIFFSGYVGYIFPMSICFKWAILMVKKIPLVGLLNPFTEKPFTFL